jgi:hypothetical protein
MENISGSNRLEVWVEDSLGASSYLNQFDIQYQGGPWLIGARLEIDEELWWDLTRGTEIIRRYAEYDQDSFYLRAGTFYTTYGRGLLVRAIQDAAVRVDRDIDGVKGGVTWGILEAQGFFGRPRNDDTEQRDDLLAGVDAGVQVIEQVNLGAGYVRQDATGEMDDPNLGRPIEELVAGRVQWIQGPLDAYLEGGYRAIHGEPDPRGGWTGTDKEDGHAWYGAISVGTLGLVAQLEGKDYLRFDAPYSTLPPVNTAGQPVNNGLDERGLGLTLTASPSNDLTFDGEATYAEARYTDQSRRSGQIHGLKNWWGKGSLLLGFEWTSEKGLEGHDARDLIGPTYEGSYYLTESMSLQLNGHVYARSDSVSSSDPPHVDYTEILTDLTLNLGSSRALTFSVLTASEPLPEFGNEDLWLQGLFRWSFGYNHDLLLMVGQERGGIVCSGGICRWEPPFAGVRLLFNSRL